MTPEGLKRTEDVPPNEFIPQWSRRKFAHHDREHRVGCGSAARRSESGTFAKRALRDRLRSHRRNRSLCFLSIISATIPRTLTSPKACRRKSSPASPASPTSRSSPAARREQLKSSPEDLPQIAKRLGVAKNVIEGSVQRAARSGARKRSANQRGERCASLGGELRSQNDRHFRRRKRYRPGRGRYPEGEADRRRAARDQGAADGKPRGARSLPARADSSGTNEPSKVFKPRSIIFEKAVAGRSKLRRRLCGNG